MMKDNTPSNEYIVYIDTNGKCQEPQSSRATTSGPIIILEDSAAESSY